jgi:cytochrome c biogenesis protein
MHNVIWDTFSSARLAIFLLIIITLLAISGTLIIQKDVQDVEQIKATYSPTVFRIFDRLGLFEVYHSWWFRGAIFLLLLNLIICSINKLPNTWKLVINPHTNITEDAIAQLPFFNKITLPQKLNQPEEKIKKALEKIVKKIQAETIEGKHIYYAQKHAFSRFGYIFTHFSLVVLLFGVFISSLFSMKGYIGLVEGGAANAIWIKSNNAAFELPFTVKVEKCWVEYYKDRPQMEKDWFSTLTIIDKDKPVATKTIQVNDPLIYRGYHFFQYSFTPNAQSRLRRLFISVGFTNSDMQRYPAYVGDIFLYTPANLKIKVLQFMPDFVVVDGKATSRSERLNNPAVLLQIIYPTGESKALWLFSKFPDFHKSVELPVDLRLEIEAQYKNFTGLMVTKDPGLQLVWVGCGLISMSLIISFYFIRRRYWIMISKDKEKKNILLIGGVCDRSHSTIDKEFRFLVKTLNKEF